MAKLELNEDGRRFDYRVGSRQFALGGMMQDPDPGTNPMNRPRVVLNGRYLGGGIVSRPPYSFLENIPDVDQVLGTPSTSVTTSQIPWHGKFITDHNPTRFNNQIIVGRWDGSSSYIQVADQPLKAPVDISSYPSLIQKSPVVERYSGHLYVGETGFLRRIYRIGEALADLPTDEILYTFDGYRVYAMHEFAGRLFVFVADPTSSANSYVFSYDGTTVYSEQTFSTLGANGASFAVFKGKLFLGITGSTNLEYRTAAGSWSNVSNANLTYSGYCGMLVPTADTMFIMGDDRISDYTEPAGVPTLTVTGAGYGMPGGWTSATSGAAVGPYAFFGGSAIYAGDSADTPIFKGPGGKQNLVKIAQWSGGNNIIVKAMAVAFNRLYFAYGYRNTANGGSATGVFATPRTLLNPYGTFGVSGAGAGASIEFMKGDH